MIDIYFVIRSQEYTLNVYIRYILSQSAILIEILMSTYRLLSNAYCT